MARQPAETGIGSASLPFGPSGGVSFSSTASPPTVPGQSDEEAIQGHPASSQNSSAGWQAVETLRLSPSGALLVLPVRSVPYLGNSFQVRLPRRVGSVGKKARWVI